jgi:hypothetical protein
MIQSVRSFVLSCIITTMVSRSDNSCFIYPLMWFGRAIAALVRSPCFEATEKSVYPLVVNSTFLFLLQNGSVINTIGLFAFGC